MVRTEIFGKVTDSEASPFIEQKDVILCRSGIQAYSQSDVMGFITKDNKPPKEKNVYLEYRPANVVVKAQELFKSLPVTKEHPMDWVNPDNFHELAGGVLDKEVTVVALDGESEGEIGLKSNITFYTRELYDYYLNNKEVSVGYKCKKHFVDNPEELGYDIVLDEITEVNHLAITRAGRGGSSVAVIDSIIGGLKPMRTGIFAWLASNKQKDSVPSSFGKDVLEAVKNSKGTTEEELACEMQSVMDSCAVLKDGETKNTLLDIVRDCFDNKEKALANKEELTATLDSMYSSAQADSVKDFAEATEDSTEKSDEKTDDSEEKSNEKTDDSEEKSDEKTDDSEEKSDACTKDSAVEFATKDDILSVLDSKLEPMVMEAVKKCLGIKDTSKPKIEGSELDSVNTVRTEIRDYSSFLD